MNKDELIYDGTEDTYDDGIARIEIEKGDVFEGVYHKIEIGKDKDGAAKPFYLVFETKDGYVKVPIGYQLERASAKMVTGEPYRLSCVDKKGRLKVFKVEKIAR